MILWQSSKQLQQHIKILGVHHTWEVIAVVHSFNERNSPPLRASQPTSDNIVESKTRIDELSEFWATQIAANIVAEILQNPPVELEHTGLQISSCQVETSSQMPCIGIENVMDAAMSESGLMEGDVVGGMTEDMPDAHCTQPPLNTPPHTPMVCSISTSMSSWLSNVSGDLSNNDINAIISLCTNTTITLTSLHHSLQYLYNLSPGVVEILVQLSEAHNHRNEEIF